MFYGTRLEKPYFSSNNFSILRYSKQSKSVGSKRFGICKDIELVGGSNLNDSFKHDKHLNLLNASE